ncbi:MAG TPA: hypothetical protein VEW46_25860 [Pyrinomonadaceae bacterium]|nr:hypothetical protein [Pyrinomonadaceae bacterium]
MSDAQPKFIEIGDLRKCAWTNCESDSTHKVVKLLSDETTETERGAFSDFAGPSQVAGVCDSHLDEAYKDGFELVAERVERAKRILKINEDYSEVNTLIGEWKEIEGILNDDIFSSIVSIMSEEDVELEKRHLVRAIFAYLEANVFGLKRIALAEAKFKSFVLSPAEIACLLEESYQLDDKGEVSIKPNYNLRLAGNIRFLLNIYSRMFPEISPIDVTTEEWGYFKKALMIRNRVTHPKLLSDIEITHTEYRTIVTAYSWIQKQCKLAWFAAWRSVSARRELQEQQIRKAVDKPA